MSVRSAMPPASLQRSARDSAQAPLEENFQSSDAHVSLSTHTLPVTTVLEFHCGPAALWNGDRSEWVFNRAATELVGVQEHDIRAGVDVWLDCVAALDRKRFLSAWQNLLSGDGTMVCRYRFVPRGRTSMIELEETALRLAAGCSGQAAILSRYQIREPRDSLSMRGLVHQIGNSLQSMRGEVDLLRLFGALPQESFDAITQGIENIHELTARLDDIDKDRRHKQSTHRRTESQSPRGSQWPRLSK